MERPFVVPRSAGRLWSAASLLAFLAAVPAAGQDTVTVGGGAVVGRPVASHTDIPSGYSRPGGGDPIAWSEDAYAAAVQFIVPPSSSSKVTITVWCQVGSSRYYAKDFGITRLYAKNGSHLSSGHAHGMSGRPLGQFSPDLGYGRDYKFVANYERGMASGDEIITFEYVISDRSLPEECQGKEGSTEIPGAVRVHGLVPIQPARWLWIQPVTTSHYGGVVYGLPALGDRLRRMSEEYFVIARHSLRLNAASLMHGGLFDVGGNWAGPYDGHRTGRDALVTGDPRRPNTPQLLAEAGAKVGLVCVPAGAYQARCSLP